MADRTYILVGDDWNGAFESFVTQIAKNPNVSIIRPTPGQTVSDAIRAANIEVPANIIIACHGGEDGTFVWNKDDPKDSGIIKTGSGAGDWQADPTYNQKYLPRYGDAFAALPRSGIDLISVTGCYGGTAIQSADVPSGAVVYSMVGSSTVGVSGIQDFLIKNPTLSAIPSLVAAFGSMDAETVRAIAYWEKEYSAKVEVQRSEMLPWGVSVGGEHGQLISLGREFSLLQSAAKNGKLDQAAFQRAVQMVHENFDLAHNNAANISGSIDNIAQKILRGDTLSAVDERVGLALTTAYLETSGRLRIYKEQAVSGKTALDRLSDVQVLDLQRFLNRELPQRTSPYDSDDVETGPRVPETGRVDYDTRAMYDWYCQRKDLDPMTDLPRIIALASVNGQLTVLNSNQSPLASAADNKSPSIHAVVAKTAALDAGTFNAIG